MTPSPPHTHIRLRDLSELIAGIPYILGFPPTESLVLFTFRRCPELALSTTMRVDLPEVEHVPLVVADLVPAIARNDVVAAIAVVVSETPAVHGKLIDMLRESLADGEILLTHASWTRRVADGEQWRCYDDPQCTGVVPDPQMSALAAAVAVAGEITYPSREAMVAHLAPEPENILARRKNLLRLLPAQPYGDRELRADLALLGHALGLAMRSYDPPTLTDHQLVRLAKALTRTPVKDECLATVLNAEPEAAERLWTLLVRTLPPPERAEPALLLAMSAYLRGAGVLAALALKIALAANAEHGMAIVLDHALQMGVPPNHLRIMLMASVARNKETRTATSPPPDDPPWETASATPATGPPGTETPGTELPVTKAAVTKAPVAEAPVAELPGTELPGTELPGTTAAAAELPAAGPPVTDAPGTEVAVAAEPSVPDEDPRSTEGLPRPDGQPVRPGASSVARPRTEEHGSSGSHRVGESWRPAEEHGLAPGSRPAEGPRLAARNRFTDSPHRDHGVSTAMVASAAHTYSVVTTHPPAGLTGDPGLENSAGAAEPKATADQLSAADGEEDSATAAESSARPRWGRP